MRQADTVITLICVLMLLFGAVILHAWIRVDVQATHIQKNRLLVSELELTDLSLFTEARYTRHLSQADRHAPFQDHPVSFEHFPSGSLTTPPDDGSASR